MRYVYQNESGVVGSIILMIIAIAVIGFLYITVSPIIDIGADVHNDYVDDGGVTTQAQNDAITDIQLAFYLTPAVCIFALVFAIIVDALRERQGVV